MLQSLAERLEVAERAAQESDASQRVAQLEQDNQLLRDRLTAAQADAERVQRDHQAQQVS